jgi:hypothetical protein
MTQNGLGACPDLEPGLLKLGFESRGGPQAVLHHVFEGREEDLGDLEGEPLAELEDLEFFLRPRACR